MKKVILSAACISAVLILARPVRAQTDTGMTQVIETVQSTATVGGVTCTTGTAVRLDTNVPDGLMGGGYLRAWARATNLNGTYSVWLGFSTNVSSDAAKGAVGELVKAEGNAPYSVGRNIQLWCIAADGAGVNGVRISLAQFGYK